MPFDPSDFQSLFETAPTLYMVLDSALRIVGASDAYVRATLKRKEEILGQRVFEIFPERIEDVEDGVVRRESFERVLREGVCDVMAVRKHGVWRSEADGGGFESRYWRSFNYPILAADGTVGGILHHVEDVTASEQRQRGLRWIGATGVGDAERIAWAMEEVKNGQVAILDQAGVIVLVNESWKVASLEFDSLVGGAEGADYLAICDSAAACGWAQARTIAAGLCELLAGRIFEFGAEYSRSDQNQGRAFGIRIVAFERGSERRFLISHNEISRRGEAPKIAQRRRAPLVGIEVGLAEVSRGMTEACFTLDFNWRFTFANEPCLFLLGRKREELDGRTVWEVVREIVSTPFERYCRRAMVERAKIGFKAFLSVVKGWLRVRVRPTRGGIAVYLLEIPNRKTGEVSRSASQRESLMGSATDAVVSVNAERKIVVFNAAAEAMFRCGQQEAMGGMLERFVVSGVKIEEANGKEVLRAMRGVRSDGEQFSLEASVSQIEVNGEPVCTLVMRELTERGRGPQQLVDLQRSTAQTAALLDTLQNHAPVGIGFVDREYRFRRVNAELATLDGVPAGLHLGHTVAEVLPGLWPQIEKILNQAIHAGETIDEHELVSASNWPQKRHWLLSAYPVRLEKEIIGAGIIVLDVTERKRMEQEILEISEREQSRFGQDLHDGLGQELAGIALLCKVLANRLKDEGHSSAQEANNLADYLGSAIGSARDLAKGLYPVELDRYGLFIAIEDLANITSQRLGIQCEFRSTGGEPKLGKAAEIHIYRMIQECIGNAIKHGNAELIVIEFFVREGIQSFSVTDDGVGFDCSAIASGMGLHLMNYRARLIGGELEVRKPAEGGCQVTCQLKGKLDVRALEPACNRKELER